MYSDRSHQMRQQFVATNRKQRLRGKKKFFRMRLKGCAFLVEHSESDLMGMHELKINFWKRVHQVLENWNTTVAVFSAPWWSRLPVGS